jgi:hypothetical protein
VRLRLPATAQDDPGFVLDTSLLSHEPAPCAVDSPYEPQPARSLRHLACCLSPTFSPATTSHAASRCPSSGSPRTTAENSPSSNGGSSPPGSMIRLSSSACIGAYTATKPSFHKAFKARRCLVVADGFYEWQTTAGGKKQPHYIRWWAICGFKGLGNCANSVGWLPLGLTTVGGRGEGWFVGARHWWGRAGATASPLVGVCLPPGGHVGLTIPQPVPQRVRDWSGLQRRRLPW